MTILCDRAGVWQKSNEAVVALDVKLTGASSGIGLSGPTMRMYLEHAQAVVREARKQEGLVGTSRVVAFLLIRPQCPTYAGKPHKGAFGFVAYDVEKLMAWDSRGNRMPTHVICQGHLLKPGGAEEDGLVLPAAPSPLVVRPACRCRWQELADLAVRPGWVKTLDFCEVFKVGQGNPAHGASRVNKRLRAEDLDSWRGGERGPPKKICRISALKRAYPDFVQKLLAVRVVH